MTPERSLWIVTWLAARCPRAVLIPSQSSAIKAWKPTDIIGTRQGKWSWNQECVAEASSSAQLCEARFSHALLQLGCSKRVCWQRGAWARASGLAGCLCPSWQPPGTPPWFLGASLVLKPWPRGTQPECEQWIGDSQSILQLGPPRLLEQRGRERPGYSRIILAKGSLL